MAKKKQKKHLSKAAVQLLATKARAAARLAKSKAREAAAKALKAARALEVPSTIPQAAETWGVSPQWVRVLIYRKLIPAKLRTDSPVSYYEIAAGAKLPKLKHGPAPKTKKKKVKVQAKKAA